ncbi:MAG: nucleotide exchange factor GrpE [Spirochaetes bacterium]|nr:nucleotide exchange factor GrpE [Spirochaetota bacterium]
MSKHHADGERKSHPEAGTDQAAGTSPPDKPPMTAGVVTEPGLDTKAEAEARIAVLDAKVAELSAENSYLKDQYLRKLADYENFRKRMFREKEDSALYANSALLVDLVGVMDNFDRAVQSADASRDFNVLHDGVVMIRQSLLSLMESKYGLRRFDSTGMEFDPNVHEAVLSEQGECGAPVVVEEFMKGYRLHDRILRTAKVKVRLPKPAAAGSGTAGAEAAGNGADEGAIGAPVG